MKYVLFTIIALAIGLAAPLGLAGEAAPEKPAAAAGPKAAEFNQAFAQWKDLLAEMRQLRADYRDAGQERKDQIVSRYEKLQQQGDALLPKLIAAAEASFVEAPNASEPQAEFLLQILFEQCNSDDYEPAFRLAKLLIDHGYGEKDKVVYGFGGLAAFSIDEFDLAEKWLTAARDGGGIDRLPGVPQQESLRDLAKQYLNDIPEHKAAWKKEQAIREAEAKAQPPLPRVLLKTSKGDIEIELFENEAPNTVANFIALVEKKFYDGTPFHRVLPHFMAQGGDPTGTGTGGPGYAVPCECYQPDFRKHFRGSLSMAHAGRDTGGSQFFLTFRPTPFLNGKHTVFGRVVKGFDVLPKIQRVDPSKQEQPEPDKILEARVLQKREHPYVPKTLPDKR